MKGTLLFLLIYLFSVPGVCQNSKQKANSVRTTPALVINFYINNKDKKRKVKAKDIVLKSRNQIYVIRDSADMLLLPFIRKEDTLSLTVMLGRQRFSIYSVPGWRIHSGATVSIGKIDNFTKVPSMAKQDNMLPTDDNYAMWDSRYRVAPEGSTLNVPDINHFKQVTYIQLAGNEQGTLMQTWEGKVK